MKKVFLLLPEFHEELEYPLPCPKTSDFIQKDTAEYTVMNVYEYYRNFFNTKTSANMAIAMLDAFDEVWCYCSYGFTKPMQYILKAAAEKKIPAKNLQKVSCKESFQKVFQFVQQFHPSQDMDEGYWKNILTAAGEGTKDGNPLDNCLFVAVMDYFEDICNDKSPKPSKDDLFKQEFRTALNFAIWSVRNTALRCEEIAIERISKSPTPMLHALIEGFKRFYLMREMTMEK